MAALSRDVSGGTHVGTQAVTSASTKGKALQIAIAIAQVNDQKAAQYFAVAMAGLVVLFSTLHWSRYIYNRYASKRVGNAHMIKKPAMVARRTRRALTSGLPGFTSSGHLLLVLTYLIINISLTVTNVSWSNLIGIAKRCGWMAISNVALVTLLALKNTPLAFLTSHSYERLNPLHQVAGYAALTYAFLHAILMCTGFSRLHNIRIILEHDQIYGMIALGAAFVILVTATFIRKMQYEIFYFTHIIMFMLIIINVGMHRPDYGLKAAIITTFAGSIWALDRIIRACRLVLHFRDNWATITALPQGGTRVVLQRPPARAVPGAHCFLWIPQIRWIETHPFTIVSVTPQSLEFVVAAHDGFTKALHRYAQCHPGAKLRASIEGPYGTLPVFSSAADKIILIAGGSGASFTFGVALDIIRKLGESNKTTVDFIWTVKEHEALSWFSTELAELQASPLVTLHLHTTRSGPFTTSSDGPRLFPTPDPMISSDEEEQTYLPEPLSPTTAEKVDFSIDIEKAPASAASATLTELAEARTPWDSTATLTTTYGRPDVHSLIKDVVSKAGYGDRVVIAACGPTGLMKAVRSTAASAMQMKGPSVELHCEAFGW